ncbi:MAG: hypothetical protein E3J30_01435 [Anaerolineales bacterium]|nr:MAG: hypothetical protein E3J30_01435 [Anaerolineales bacterium]
MITNELAITADINRSISRNGIAMMNFFEYRFNPLGAPSMRIHNSFPSRIPIALSHQAAASHLIVGRIRRQARDFRGCSRQI